ncbi:MAG: outer membrane protein assembly factor BamB family protein [Armatimonadota bacterium]
MMMTPTSPYQRRITFLLLGMLSLLLPALTGLCADEWTGWRGVERGNHAARAVGPQQWSPSHNVRWKTAIPGKGHSTPIVTEDSIYLTTSHRTPVGIPWRTVFGVLFIACGLCFFVFVLRAVALESGGADSPLPRLTGVMLLLLGFLFLLVFSEQIIDFDRTPERPWLGIALFGTFTLYLAGLFARRDSRAPLLAGIGLLIFTGVLAVLSPHRWLIAQQPGNVQSVLYLAFMALAALAGVLHIGRYLAAKSPSAGLALRVIALLGMAGAAAWLLAASFGQYRGILAGVSSWLYYEPPLPWWVVFPGAGVLLATAAIRRRADGRAAGLAAALGAALFLVTLIFAGFGYALKNVLFVSHLWGTPHWIPTPNNYGLWWPLPLGAVLGAALTAAAWRWAKDSAGLPAFARWLAVPMLAMFAAYTLLPLPPLIARKIVALDRQTGEIKWTSAALLGPRGIVHPDNSSATPTPVTDGERIYAFFGSAGVLCVDRQGRTVWTNRQPQFRTRMGVSSSPILCDGKLIIDNESDAERYLYALDCRTGDIAWRTDRGKRIHNYAGNCRTPEVMTINGRRQIVMWGFEDISGYDPQDGQELWSHLIGDLGKANNPVNSFVSDGKYLYLLGISEAMKLDIAKLPTENDPIVWWVKRQEQRKRGLPGRETLPYNTQCPTPILQNGLLFALTDDGLFYCMDPADGKMLWLNSLGQKSYSSPIAIGERIYFSSTKGRTVVVSAERKFKRLATNTLDGGIFATLVPVDGQLLIRTEKYLYCVEEKDR